MISGIVTAILMIAFFIMLAWAWSERRKEDFEHLSPLPLEDDNVDLNAKKGEENGNV